MYNIKRSGPSTVPSRTPQVNVSFYILSHVHTYFLNNYYVYSLPHITTHDIYIDLRTIDIITSKPLFDNFLGRVNVGGGGLMSGRGVLNVWGECICPRANVRRREGANVGIP